MTRQNRVEGHLTHSGFSVFRSIAIREQNGGAQSTFELVWENKGEFAALEVRPLVSVGQMGDVTMKPLATAPTPEPGRSHDMWFLIEINQYSNSN